MKSLISEFSYGFALTHELVLALGNLTAAPIFPSLIEEGRAGGGYDVKLAAPGIPLFLQFKRSDCLSRRSAREIQSGAPLTTPFYWIEITAKADSAQHEMLIDLDEAPNLVFYAAPMFHQKVEFDAAFIGGHVRQRSFFVRPRTIGTFGDDGPHHLSFDGNTCVIMSEPKIIEALGAAELAILLGAKLDEERRPLRETIDNALREAGAAQNRSRERLARRETRSRSQRSSEDEPYNSLSVESFRQRQEGEFSSVALPRYKEDPENYALSRLADIGLREFNAQLYIVQSRIKD